MAKSKLDVETREFSALRLNGRRYPCRLAILVKKDLLEQAIIVQEETEITIGGIPGTPDDLILWADRVGAATVFVTTDPKQYGRCLKLEFTENPR